MRPLSLISLTALALVSPLAAAADAAVIRVACIGDSITAGAGADAAHSYPTQVQALLGAGYKVGNFGVSGTTLSSLDGDAYIKQGAWKAAQDFKPDIALIMLGTNDSKPQVAVHAATMKADLEAMVKTLQAADPKPQVVICLPCFVVDPGNYGIDEQRLMTTIMPEIQNAVNDLKLPVVDIQAVTMDAATKDPGLLPDRVHPNADGYAIIAKAVQQEVLDLAKKP